MTKVQPAHTRRRRDLAPQPPCSCLLRRSLPTPISGPGDRAQDEQPTLQAGPSHTGAHDAHNSATA
eukprot:scaffold32834_cov63-Phaeocystis_antarctica.AAC.2